MVHVLKIMFAPVSGRNALHPDNEGSLACTKRPPPREELDKADIVLDLIARCQVGVGSSRLYALVGRL